MRVDEKKPLILLHGALGGAGQFTALGSELADRFEVHVPELPGHGAAPLGQEAFGFPGFVAALRAYIEHHGIRRPLVFGHSMGGVVALLLALSGDVPLRGIVTLGTKLEWTPEVAAREVSFMDPDKIQQKVPAFGRTLEQRHRALGWKRLLDYTREMTAGLGEHPPLTPDQLAAVRIPVFVGAAEKDHLVPHDEARRAVAQIPEGTFWSPRGAHPLESVDADELAQRLREFAERIAG